MKNCGMCNQSKELKNFSVNSKSKDKLDLWCKDCRSSYHKAKYPRSMSKMYQNENSKQCRKCGEIKLNTEFRLYKSKRNTYCKVCTAEIGHTNNLTRFGLTPDSYMKMLIDQNGVCYICGGKERTNKKRLSIDHNHLCHSEGSACKKCIRKLLCHQCNMALGAIKDNINILKKMISYLEEHST